MTNKRYEHIPGLGIHDTKTDEYYITPQEILWLINNLNQQIKEQKN